MGGHSLVPCLSHQQVYSEQRQPRVPWVLVPGRFRDSLAYSLHVFPFGILPARFFPSQKGNRRKKE